MTSLTKSSMSTKEKGQEKGGNFLGLPPWSYVLLLVAIPPIACSVTYALAVHFGHVYADFPTISIAVNDPPENCIFSVLLNLYAVCSTFVAYIRFKHVEMFYKEEKSNPKRTNKIAFACGLLTSLGVFLTANFQIEYVMVVHLIGSFSLFFFGMMYCWIQTVMSYFIKDLPGNKSFVRTIRLVFSITQTVLFIIFFVTWPMYEDPFWYRIAAISEWVLCFALSTYVVTFVHQFRSLTWESRVTLTKPRNQPPREHTKI